MSSTITAARNRTAPRNLFDRRAAATAAREDVLAAVAEAQAGDPAGATNALLAELTADLDFSDRITALVWLQEDGLVIRDRHSRRLRLTDRGRQACQSQWADDQVHGTEDVLTDVDARDIVAQFQTLVDRSPELGLEVRQTLSRPWRIVDRAALRGSTELSARERAQVNCLVDGIQGRLDDLVRAA